MKPKHKTSPHDSRKYKCVIKGRGKGYDGYGGLGEFLISR